MEQINVIHMRLIFDIDICHVTRKRLRYVMLGLFSNLDLQ